MPICLFPRSCSLYCFYIKPQHVWTYQIGVESCSLYCFYIKPQRLCLFNIRKRVVPYIVSTSNHNHDVEQTPKNPLFLILFLHQTTTLPNCTVTLEELFLILFLHQTTTPVDLLGNSQEVTAVQRRTKWVPGCLRSGFDAIFFYLTNANILKRFQLLGCCEFCSLNFSPKVLYFAILLIGYVQNTNLSRWWHRGSYSGYVDSHIFPRWAVAHINRVLHHRKTIFLQCLAKLGGIFAFLFRVGWQVEKYKQPHNMISI